MNKYTFVDSHCHLTFKKFLENNKNADEHKYSVEALVKRANQAGVKYILTIGTELSDIDESREIVENHKNIFRTIGIHALEARKHYNNYSLKEILHIILENCHAQSPSCPIGIGEIGLDYYYNHDDIKEQQELLDLQLDLADQCSLPVCIHSRQAEEDTIRILKNHPNVKGVIHCFTGSKDFAFKALDLGFYISVSGIITFKKSEVLQEIIKSIPIDRLLIETDAPFLAPDPFRGYINEPAFVVHTAQKLADLLETTIEIVAEKTSKNFFKIFQIK